MGKVVRLTREAAHMRAVKGWRTKHLRHPGTQAKTGVGALARTSRTGDMTAVRKVEDRRASVVYMRSNNVTVHNFNERDEHAVIRAIKKVDAHLRPGTHMELNSIRNVNIGPYLKRHGATGYKSVDGPLVGSEDEAAQQIPAAYHPKNKHIIVSNEHSFPGENVREQDDVESLMVHELGHAADPYLHPKKDKELERYLSADYNRRDWSRDRTDLAQYRYANTNSAEDFAEQFRHHIGVPRKDGVHPDSAWREQMAELKPLLDEDSYNKALAMGNLSNVPSEKSMFGYSMANQHMMHNVRRSPDRDAHMQTILRKPKKVRKATKTSTRKGGA